MADNQPHGGGTHRPALAIDLAISRLAVDFLSASFES